MSRKVHFENLSQVFDAKSIRHIKLPNPSTWEEAPENFPSVAYFWKELPEITALLQNDDKHRAYYLTLSEEAEKIVNGLVCTQGPGDLSHTRTVRVTELPDSKIQVYATGWGSSYVVLWVGSKEELLNHIKTR